MKLKSLLIAFLFFAGGTALAADKPVDVRDVMTASQFHATGLDTLKPDQLAAFNAWLAVYTHAPAAGTAAAAAPAVAAVAAPVPVAATPAPATASNFGGEMLSPKERGEPDRIESRILGTFNGWNGRTVFTLENGQVWKQADSSSYDVTLQDPPVVIKRLGLGYLLTLPGHSGTVFVKRIH